MPPRRRKTNSKKPKPGKGFRRRRKRKPVKVDWSTKHVARARWVAHKYGIPLRDVLADFATLDSGAYDVAPRYVTWEMLRAYDKRNLLEEREEEFVRRLLASNDPRLEDAVERCLIANEMTEPFNYHSRPRRSQTPVNSLALIEKNIAGEQTENRSHFRRAQVLPKNELQPERGRARYPISQVEWVRVHCKKCKLAMEVHIADASPLFQSGHCPYCSQALFPCPTVENEPFMVLWRALRRFRELRANYSVEFLLFEIDE